ARRFAGGHRQLLADDPQRLRPSERGQLFLNDLLQHFLP
ncbi:hypothetical protein RBU07_22405, partial [Pseudomonas aeruginosa]|nr:hypothetical protein [Pseudomonas aeruginosa]